MVPNAPKKYETRQNISLGSNGIDQVRSLGKFLTPLRGTKFCTSSARFAPIFIRHPNSTRHTKIWVMCPMGWIGCVMRKIPTRLCGTHFCTNSPRFKFSLVRQPNSPKCIQIVWIAPKHQFRVQWGGSVAFVAKTSDGTSWHEVFHQFDPFCTRFCKATKQSQMHPNSTKHTKTWV